MYSTNLCNVAPRMSLGSQPRPASGSRKEMFSSMSGWARANVLIHSAVLFRPLLPLRDSVAGMRRVVSRAARIPAEPMHSASRASVSRNCLARLRIAISTAQRRLHLWRRLGLARAA